MSNTTKQNKQSDLEALILLNVRECFKAYPKNFAQKLADDIQEQFELTYKTPTTC